MTAAKVLDVTCSGWHPIIILHSITERLHFPRLWRSLYQRHLQHEHDEVLTATMRLRLSMAKQLGRDYGACTMIC